MNWLESIEEAIGYIESHLKDDLSVEDVASHVYMSSGYFQKAFSMLCGFTVVNIFGIVDWQRREWSSFLQMKRSSTLH